MFNQGIQQGDYFSYLSTQMIQIEKFELVPLTLEEVKIKIERMKACLALMKTGQPFYEDQEVYPRLEEAIKIHNRLAIEISELLQLVPNAADVSSHAPFGGNSYLVNQAVQSDSYLSVKSQLEQGSLMKHFQIPISQQDIIQKESSAAVIGNYAPRNETQPMRQQHLQQANLNNQPTCDLCCIQ